MDWQSLRDMSQYPHVPKELRANKVVAHLGNVNLP